MSEVENRPVSEGAEEVARILEGPAKPSNPRYDNLDLGPISDVLIRIVRDQPFEIDEHDFHQATLAADTYLDARKDEDEAKTRKNNAAAFLIGIANRIPSFRGIGFPKRNSSATIVAEKNKSVPDENVPEVVRQAGVHLQEFGTQQIELTVNVPVSLTDRRGKPLSADELQRRLGIAIGKMLRPEDRGLYKFARKLKVTDWKALAKLVRQDTVSHDLIEAEEDLIVRPIALSQISVAEEKAVSPDAQASL